MNVLAVEYPGDLSDMPTECLTGSFSVVLLSPVASKLILVIEENTRLLAMAPNRLAMASIQGYGLLHHMEPSEAAVYEVALTAFRFLVDDIGVRYSQIILFGRSLGRLSPHCKVFSANMSCHSYFCCIVVLTIYMLVQ